MESRGPRRYRRPNDSSARCEARWSGLEPGGTHFDAVPHDTSHTHAELRQGPLRRPATSDASSDTIPPEAGSRKPEAGSRTCARVTVMGVVSWLRRPGLSSSPSESGSTDCRRAASRRAASSSDGFAPSSARAVAGSRSAARRLRRGAPAVLPRLPLPPGLAVPVAAPSAPAIFPSTLAGHGLGGRPRTGAAVGNLPPDRAAPPAPSPTVPAGGAEAAFAPAAVNDEPAGAVAATLRGVCTPAATGPTLPAEEGRDYHPMGDES